MLTEFEQKIAGFVEANDLFGSADEVLLAVSGGADSTALLSAMSALKTNNILRAELLCAHINHRLRAAEADLDEQFVVAEAARMKLTVKTKRVDVRAFAHRNRLSIETAARELRIRSLIDIARANKCSVIATAHQKNDNAETILQRLTRGTAFRGLGGIWPMRVFADGFKFVRPLLCVKRDEIIRYLEGRNLQWRQDHTNADCTYRRNYIRHRLLPALQQNCSGSLVEQLSKLSESAHAFHRLVCDRADAVWPKAAGRAGQKITLDLNVLLNESRPVIIELIRRSLATIGCGERDITRRHYVKIMRLAEQNVTGRKMELPGGFVVWREYGNLVLAKSEQTGLCGEKANESVQLRVPGRTEFGEHLIESRILETDEKKLGEFKDAKDHFVEWFDLGEVKLPVAVRCRRAGDRFIPLGLGEEKKVGKFLTAAKVPLELREKVLVVTDSEKIIWVWPVRMSERARVTAKTRKILQLQIMDTGK